MRIGLIKPDYGVAGGFELVLDRVTSGLERDGHTVQQVIVDATTLGSPVLGVAVADKEFTQAPEFFRYLSLVERCRSLDVSGFDLVISTLPGSMAAQHPRHLAMMYHHQRVFYDLADIFVRGGFVNPEIHELCVSSVREIDTELFGQLAGVLACSEEFDRRLVEYNQIQSVGIFHAGIGFDGEEIADVDPSGPGNEILCVSRHEFPKRTELFAQAAALHQRPARIIGGGGRLPWVSELARRWHDEELEIAACAAEETWLCQVPPEFQVTPEPATIGTLRLAGRVSSEELHEAYAHARCVVAPAFREDYGLTVIEAMAHGRPVIVCEDGGGLVDFVADGECGLVVEPTASAIAEAVERLASDDDLAAAMGAAALERSRLYTWERGWTELRAALDRVCLPGGCE